MKGNFLSVFCVIVTLLSNGIHEGSAMINGEIADPADFKYLVDFWNSTLHLCGGAILDDWHVLTGAHCLMLPNETLHTTGITLVAGAANLKEIGSTFTTTVEKFYLTNNLQDDVAVLRVRDKFNLEGNPNLAAVQLPENKADIDAYANKTIQYAGYGFDSSKAIKINDATWLKEVSTGTGQLYKSPLFIYDHAKGVLEVRKGIQFYTEWVEAKEVLDFPEHATLPTSIRPDIAAYPDEALVTDKQIFARMTAHGLDSDAKQGLCNGDSGCPVVDGNTVIALVSASGIECNDRGYPNALTIVSPYLDFIRNAMNDNVVEGMRVSSILPEEQVPLPELTHTQFRPLA